MEYIVCINDCSTLVAVVADLTDLRGVITV